MTAFVHVDQPTTHPGVERAAAVARFVHDARSANAGARGLAAVLLAAVVAALLAVADRFVSNWTEGNLLAAWMVFWAIAFFAMAMFAGAARALAVRALSDWREMQGRMAAARADAQFLATARSDPRVMGELHAAITRQQSLDEEYAFVAPAAVPAVRPSQELRMPTIYEAMRRLHSARHY